ncbi:MAG: hypothetical protein DHS20C13_16530 [Thermodesulfobacteriota bacterium]|nr:MAG: hypothetical protein DHS20C13_16530 [Thermodesulfobacteriota bacterium]
MRLKTGIILADETSKNAIVVNRKIIQFLVISEIKVLTGTILNIRRSKMRIKEYIKV